MQVVNDRNVMVFLKDYEGKELYSIGMSKKDMNGNYINGYLTCRFKKDTHLKNKTIIKIKDAWLDFYLKDKKTYPYVFINEFDVIEESKDIEENKQIEKDAYEEFGESIIIEESELPF